MSPMADGSRSTSAWWRFVIGFGAAIGDMIRGVREWIIATLIAIVVLALATAYTLGIPFLLFEAVAGPSPGQLSPIGTIVVWGIGYGISVVVWNIATIYPISRGLVAAFGEGSNDD